MAVESIRIPADATSFTLGDGCVVLREASQSLFALEPWAAFLWQELCSGSAPESAARVCAERFGCEAREASVRVAATLEEWHANGLVGPSSVRSMSFDDPTALDEARLASGEIRNLRFHRCSFQIGDVVVSVEATDPKWIEQIAWEFRGCLLDAERPAEGSVHLYWRGDRIAVCRSDRLCCEVQEEGLIPEVHNALLQESVRLSDYAFCFDGALLAHAGDLLLLAGPPGSGKSTLAYGLIRAGLHSLGDELALWGEGRGFTPLCLPIALRPDSWPRVRPGDEELGPAHRLPDGGSVRYWTAPAPAPLEGPGLSATVFPRFQADAETELRPIDPLLAATHLLGECVAVAQRLRAESVAALMSHLDRAQHFELVYGDLDEGVAALGARLS